MPVNNKKRAPKTKSASVTAVRVSSGNKHKQSLSKLQETDPEFYKFLKNEDTRLLNFEAEDESGSGGSEGESSGEEESMEEEEDTEDAASDDESLGSIPDSEEEEEVSGEEEGSSEGEVSGEEEDGSGEEGEAESDEQSDEEGLPQTDGKTRVTTAMVDKWTTAMKDKPSPKVLHEFVMALRAAVQQVGSDEADSAPTKYRVSGTDVFNAVVRGCITTFYPGLQKMLGISSGPSDKTVLPSTSPRWSKVRVDVKTYLTEMLQLMRLLSASSVLDAVLKHVLVMVPCYACFPKISRVLLKRAIGVWSTSSDSSRVVAFLVINKLVAMQQDHLLQSALKQMYMAYVSNCKFTSPTTLAAILFLQRSLVEMLSIDPHVTYQYAFVYIRQLAIHLRNAITVKNEENIRAVYNWQYIHSAGVWTELLCSLNVNPILQPLIYPLTQVIIGTIRLQATARYLPLRFHCIKFLNKLCQCTRTYIPVLPLMMEVFDLVNFNKKHKAVSFKPFNFACLLKFSKSQLQGRAFKDGVMEHLVENMLDHLHAHSHCIGFPELVLPAQIQMKKFVKTCKIQSYTKQVKQVLGRTEETCKVILVRRRAATLSLSDHTATDAWERRSAEQGTPLSKFYGNWRKQRDMRLQVIMSSGITEQDLGASDDDDDSNTRKGKKKDKKDKKKRKRDEDFDDDDDDDFTAEELAVLDGPGSDDDSGKKATKAKKQPQQKKSKKESAKKTKHTQEDVSTDGQDIVKDFSFSSDED